MWRDGEPTSNASNPMRAIPWEGQPRRPPHQTRLTRSPVMIDLRQFAEERPLSLPDAASYIGKLTGTAKPNVSTLWRWCMKGCKGVKLASICIGGKRYVTVSAIERFIEARSVPDAQESTTTAASTPRALQHVERLPGRRREEIEAARRKLDRLTGRPQRAEPDAPESDPIRSA